MMISDIVGQDVSRETENRLRLCDDLLHKWTKRINLVSPKTLSESWQRHILDSAQIMPLAGPDAESWVDIGSGGGFPALVIAILAAEIRPRMQVTMIESDLRKCTFLRTVLREADVKATVISTRIETAEAQNADIISARALAGLSDLLGYAQRHRKPQGQCLFMKGENWLSEVADAQESWTFDLTPHKSKTDPKAAILEIGNFAHV